MKSIKVVALVGALTVGFENCAQTNFGAAPAAPAAAAQTPVPTPNPTPNPGLQMRLYTPSCPGYSNCPATFTLVETPTQTLTFTWQTNDTRWETDTTGVYAKPNVNYVPTSGTLSFAAGVTVQTINIQSLSFNDTLKIPFLWMNCMSGGQQIQCPTVVQ